MLSHLKVLALKNSWIICFSYLNLLFILWFSGALFCHPVTPIANCSWFNYPSLALHFATHNSLDNRDSKLILLLILRLLYFKNLQVRTVMFCWERLVWTTINLLHKSTPILVPTQPNPSDTVFSKDFFFISSNSSNIFLGFGT